VSAFKDISYDLINGIFTVLDGNVTYDSTDYNVYKSLPKAAPDNYVHVTGVIQTEDGTKDDFHYYGTVQVRVVTDNVMRADKKLAQAIMNVVRGLLKPSKKAVFDCSPSSLIVFKHESFNELIEQSDEIGKVTLIDIYSFLIV